MIDGADQAARVQRAVSARTLPAGEARVVTLAQTYDTTVEDLWDACTNPERLPRWFLPVSGDLRPGGRYALEGNASGTIERCEPPRFLRATWEFGGMVSWIELHITADAGGARLQLDHIAHPDEHWDQYGPGAVGIGWDLALIGLVLHLRTGEAVDAAAAQAWPTTEEGAAFVAEVGRRWGEADAAAGADRAAAEAAAARTVRFYTGAPEPG